MQTKLGWTLVVASVVVGVSPVGGVLATPSSGFSGTTIALGRFDDIDVRNHVPYPESFRTEAERNFWTSMQKAKGPSDLYVQDNVWQPGGTTGWHTHPGHSLIIVTAGTITAYDADDPSCTPRVYTEGMGFVDEGGDHAHVLRNEGSVEARTIAVQLLPASAPRRIDAPAPMACPF